MTELWISSGVWFHIIVGIYNLSLVALHGQKRYFVRLLLNILWCEVILTQYYPTFTLVATEYFVALYSITNVCASYLLYLLPRDPLLILSDLELSLWGGLISLVIQFYSPAGADQSGPILEPFQFIFASGVATILFNRRLIFVVAIFVMEAIMKNVDLLGPVINISYINATVGLMSLCIYHDFYPPPTLHSKSGPVEVKIERGTGMAPGSHERIKNVHVHNVRQIRTKCVEIGGVAYIIDADNPFYDQPADAFGFGHPT